MRFISLVAVLAIAAILTNPTGAGAQSYKSSYASGSYSQSDAWMARASRSYGGGGY
jgi:hypothetical protein